MDSSFCSGGSSSQEESMHLMEELDANQYGTFVELLDLHRYHDFLELQLNTLKNNSSVKGIRLMLAQLHHEIEATEEQRQMREDLAYNEDAEQAHQMMARLRGLSARIQSHRLIQDRRRTKKVAQRSQSDGQLPRFSSKNSTPAVSRFEPERRQPTPMAAQASQSDDQLPRLSPKSSASKLPQLEPERRLPTPMAALLSLPDPQNIHATREILTVEKEPEEPAQTKGQQTGMTRQRDCSESDITASFDRYAHNLTQQSSLTSLEQLHDELDECHKKLFEEHTICEDRLTKLKENHKKLEACQAEIIRRGDLGEVSSRTVDLAKEVFDISRARIIENDEADQESRHATADHSDPKAEDRQRNLTTRSPQTDHRHPVSRPLPPLPVAPQRKTYKEAVITKSSTSTPRSRRKPWTVFVKNTTVADSVDGKQRLERDDLNDSGVGEDVENEWVSCSEDEFQQDMKQAVRESLDSALHEMRSVMKSSLSHRHVEDYDVDLEPQPSSEEDITVCIGDELLDDSVSEFSSGSEGSTVVEIRTPSLDLDLTSTSGTSMPKQQKPATRRLWRYLDASIDQNCLTGGPTEKEEIPGPAENYSLRSWVSRLHDQSSLRCLDGLHSAFYDELLAQPKYYRAWKNHEQSMQYLASKTYIPNDIHHRSPNSFDLLSLHGDDTLQDYEVCREDNTDYDDCVTYVSYTAPSVDAISRGHLRGGAPGPIDSSSRTVSVKLDFIDRSIIRSRLAELDGKSNGGAPDLTQVSPGDTRTRIPGNERPIIFDAVRDAEQANIFDKHLEIAASQVAEQPVYVTGVVEPAAPTSLVKKKKKKTKNLEKRKRKKTKNLEKKKSKKTKNLEEESQSSSDIAYIEDDPCEEFSLTWIESHLFTNSRGNEYFCDIDDEYLNDRFNLTSLNTEVQYYQYALDLVTDMLEIECEDEMRETIEKSARHLYGLVHARYIVTTRGLQKMCEKYKAGDFGKCPRVACDGTHLLPMGQNDTANISPVKLYCAKCEDLYNPKSSRHATVDGAYFGTSFHNIFFQVYPSMMPAKSQKRYEPRVFGFKMHASAALARWQNEHALALRERVMKEGLETGFEAEDRERDGEGSEVEEQDGIDDMFEAGTARVPQVLR